MNLNIPNAFTIRLVPQRSTGELFVSMTAVADGTRSVFTAPASSWDDYSHELQEKIGIEVEYLEEASIRLRSGVTAKLSAKCFVTDITQIGFALAHR